MSVLLERVHCSLTDEAVSSFFQTVVIIVREKMKKSDKQRRFKTVLNWRFFTSAADNEVPLLTLKRLKLKERNWKSLASFLLMRKRFLGLSLSDRDQQLRFFYDRCRRMHAATVL